MILHMCNSWLLTTGVGNDRDRDVEPTGRAHRELVLAVPRKNRRQPESSPLHQQPDLRADVELRERHTIGSVAVAAHTARAATCRAVAVRIAAGAAPDVALPAGEQVRGVLLPRGELEAACRVAVVVLHGRVEGRVDLLLAVVDEGQRVSVA